MSEQLRTSFINNVAGLVLPVTLSLCFFVLFFISLSVYFIYDAYILNSSYTQKKSHLDKLTNKSLSLKTEDLVLPTSNQMQALNDSVAKINGVGAAKGRNISILLSELESIIPKSAYIRKLEHNRHKGVMLLVAEANAVDHLTAFLKNLEGSSAFVNVLLTRQNKDKSNGMYQYEMRLVEAPL